MHGSPYGYGTMVGAADTRDDIDQLNAEIVRFGEEVRGKVAAASDIIQQGPKYKALHDRAIAAYNRIEALPLNAHQERIAAVALYRQLQDQAADEYNQRAQSHPLLRWYERSWRPFALAWVELRDAAYKRVGTAPGWGREYTPVMPGVRFYFEEVRNKAPF